MDDKIVDEYAVNRINRILDFLGSENVEEIKRVITEKIIENIEESIDERYLILPTTFQELYDDIVDEVMKKYRAKIKKAMCEKVENMIGKMKSEIIEEDNKE